MSEITEFGETNNRFNQISVLNKKIALTFGTAGELKIISFFDRKTNKEVEVEIYDKRIKVVGA